MPGVRVENVKLSKETLEEIKNLKKSNIIRWTPEMDAVILECQKNNVSKKATVDYVNKKFGLSMKTTTGYDRISKLIKNA